jgi:hypothetical protein
MMPDPVMLTVPLFALSIAGTYLLLRYRIPIWIAIVLALYHAIADYDRTRQLAVNILTWWSA